jgi:hypothetical protein
MAPGAGWLSRIIFATVIARACVACAGDYPLPPTRCDQWCDATRGGNCYESSYDPAGCVASCERGMIAEQTCAAELDASIACYRAHPEAAAEKCRFSPAGACVAADQALATCASHLPGRNR